MDGKLTYIYLPVRNLATARTFYRDQLGFIESWREGELTCAFQLPGTTIQLMLNEASAESPDTAGLVFTIPNVDSFYKEQQTTLAFTKPPIDIPGNGRWVGAHDVEGNGLYFADVE